MLPFFAVHVPFVPPSVAASIPLALSYLVGALPFGYIVGRLRGVNLFTAGSGNIGATNAARVLGKPFGVLVFVFDFLKGAVPVVLAVPLAEALSPGSGTAFGSPDVLRVCAAALAFLGHLFPVYLGFRGGKGVATGAGTVFFLAPGPASVAILMWVVVLFASRMVSLASIAAVTLMVLARLGGTPDPFASENLPITLYLVIGAGFVIVKHRANIKRLLSGTESRIGDFSMRDTVVRGLHILALGLWFGGAAFFNFGTALPIFESFKEVVANSPSDRTGGVQIVPAGTSDKKKEQLANALAGSAVGPVFPRYFAMQAACGLVALATALSWYRLGGTHRWRLFVISAALLTVTIGWPISAEVSRLRVERYKPDGSIDPAIQAAFMNWHLVSLLLSFVTVVLAGIALALAAKLPGEARPSSAKPESQSTAQNAEPAVAGR